MRGKNILLVLIMAIILCFVPTDVSRATRGEIEVPLKKENLELVGNSPRLSFEVISDTHTPGSDDTHPTNKILINTLDHLKREHPENSLVMNCGDFTDRGSENEMKGYYDILGRYDSFDYMTGLGNHETMYINYKEAKERFLRYNNRYMPRDKKNVYYDKWVDGYHFIMLGTEQLLHLESFISSDQLEWLDRKMAEGADPSKPIFVGLHQPLRDTFKNSNKWPVGVQDHALKEILRKYPQTILFSGHLHDGLGSVEVLETDFGTMVNVPSLRYNEKTSPGGTQGELGFHVRVYDDKVKIDLKDYRKNVWIGENSYTIDLDPESKPIGKIVDMDFDDENFHDRSGYENHGKGIGEIEFVRGKNGGRAIRLINQNYPEELDQYIEFEDIELLNEDFTIVFSYKNEEDKQWHGVVAVIEQGKKDSMIIYINGKEKKKIGLKGKKYSQLNEDIFRLILENDKDLNKLSKNLIIDNLKVYHYALGAAEIETIEIPFQILRGANNIGLTWDNDTWTDREAAYVSINGKKIKDILAGEGSLNISNLESNKIYDVKIVTRYLSNKAMAGVYSFKVKTLKADINKDNLLRLYNLHNNKKKEDYKDRYWKVFESALDYAELVLENMTISGEEIEEAIDKLVDAVEGLGGWVKNGNGWWYKNPIGARDEYPKDRWALIGGKYYYFNSSGYREYGWLEYEDKWYYLNEDGVMEVGWLTKNRNWYYMDKSGVMKTGWHKEDSDYYYFDIDGSMTTGWVIYNNLWYYMAGNGLMQKGWIDVRGQRYFMDSSGAMKTGWAMINKNWYYLNDSGVMQKGWMEDKGKTYYLNNKGEMCIGWYKLDNNWYYSNSGGVIQKGWKNIDGEWYYLNSKGIMETGWVKLGSTWYYMRASGVMETGWVKLGSSWYYMKDSGAMETGWVKLGSSWYYMNNSGAMQTGWIKVAGKDYYLYNNGSMAYNTSINGYRVGHDGAWIKN